MSFGVFKRAFLPIKTGRIPPVVIATGILARPGDEITVGGPEVKTAPGGRIMTGLYAGLTIAPGGAPAKLTLGAAPKEGVRRTKGWPPGTPAPGGRPTT